MDDASAARPPLPRCTWGRSGMTRGSTLTAGAHRLGVGVGSVGGDIVVVGDGGVAVVVVVVVVGGGSSWCCYDFDRVLPTGVTKFLAALR